MSYRIHIPKPCHADWNAMTPDEQGRHCALCNKTVIDFTNWPVEDIIDYLKRRENVCGRLDSALLMAPQEDAVLQSIIQSSLSYWKKVAAIILICFGLISTSFAQKNHQQKTDTDVQEITLDAPGPTMGAPVLPAQPKHCTDTTTSTTGSSQIKKPRLMGKIKIVTPAPPPEQPLMGDVIISDTMHKKSN